jgi:cytochrome c5
LSHRIILRIAITLTVFFLFVALAFAWSAKVHDASLTTTPNAAISATDGAPASGSVGAAAPRAAGIENFERRCARCHDTEDVTGWVSKQPGDHCNALYEFLQKHGKAPEPENYGIALLFAPGCDGVSH